MVKPFEYVDVCLFMGPKMIFFSALKSNDPEINGLLVFGH